MKKGITLIELLVVIIIIGVISAITLPIINGVIRNSRANLFSVQINEIERAAKNWAYRNDDRLPIREEESITLTLLTLKQDGLIAYDITDPRDETLLPNDMEITITFRDNNFVYFVDEDSGTRDGDECIDIECIRNAPRIILRGRTVEHLEINSVYNNQFSKICTGTPNEVCGVEPINNGTIHAVYRKVHPTPGVMTTIHTHELATYTITYTATVNVNGVNQSFRIVRTVIIRDTEPPVFTHFPVEEITITRTQAQTFNLQSVVIDRVKDNSGCTFVFGGTSGCRILISGFNTLIGRRIVTYTAIDASGNRTVERRFITIIAD